MSKPLVSICCTAYNHQHFIKECLDGFLMQQTNFDIEILIHDDASEDGTKEIIKSYKDKYPDIIKPIFQIENQYSQGIKPWPNFVFPKAQGKYIALCEGDDYWADPLKLQKQVDFLEEHPDFVVCCHNAKIVDAEGKLLQDKKLPNLNEDKVYSETDLKKGAFLLTLSMVFRNLQTFKNYPTPKRKILNGDTFLISLLGRYGKGYYMEDIKPAVYRVHEGGIWSMKKRDQIFFQKNRISLYKSLLEIHKDDDEIVSYFEEKLTNSYRFFMRNLEKLSFDKMLDVNVNYLKRHNFVNERFRLKELLKGNYKYLKHQFTKVK